VGRWRILAAIFGALSPHPKIPFPAGGLEHEVWSGTLPGSLVFAATIVAAETSEEVVVAN
jgi:hypothetical protein